MGPIGATGTGLAAAASGIQRGTERFSAAGERFSAELDPAAAVDMKVAGLQVEASARVARSIDESLGTLIDDLA